MLPLYTREKVMQDKLITYLEDLSNLTLSHDEKQHLTEDIEKILNYIARLGELNTDGVLECCHPFDAVNDFRDDEVTSSFDRELILKNASARNKEMFIAPKTVEVI